MKTKLSVCHLMDAFSGSVSLFCPPLHFREETKDDEERDDDRTGLSDLLKMVLSNTTKFHNPQKSRHK